jgi:hypothetical protein
MIFRSRALASCSSVAHRKISVANSPRMQTTLAPFWVSHSQWPLRCKRKNKNLSSVNSNTKFISTFQTKLLAQPETAHHSDRSVPARTRTSQFERRETGQLVDNNHNCPAPLGRHTGHSDRQTAGVKSLWSFPVCLPFRRMYCGLQCVRWHSAVRGWQR